MHKHCFTETETQLNALELYVSVPWSFFFFYAVLNLNTVMSFHWLNGTPKGKHLLM